MRTYTRKQMGVIYRAVKDGKLDDGGWVNVDFLVEVPEEISEESVD